jgi:hypothetical protein
LPVPPALLRAMPCELSESGCPAGCRTHHCPATESTCSSRTRAASTLPDG